MKNFTLLIAFLLLNLGVSHQGFSVTNGDCGCSDSENAIKNGGFESGTSNWKKTGSDAVLGTTYREYNECGNYNGYLKNSGTIYQEAAVVEGGAVSMTVYAGTHDTRYTHTLKLTFYNSSGQVVSIPANDQNTVNMNHTATLQSKLQRYTLSAKVPAGATKVRFSGISNGNYLKLDGACMTVSPPCGCPEDSNPIKNGSFENDMASWDKKGSATFRTDYKIYNVCGDKSGLIDGAGTLSQDVNLTQGTKVDLTVYGGTHAANLVHTFKLEFFTSSGSPITIPVTPENTVDMNHQVTSNNQLKKYTLSATAPLGAAKVRFSIISGGNYFKVDVVCMTLTPPTPPVCDECSNNKLVNGSFESGTENWTTSGDITASNIIASCGSKSLILSGTGSFYQDVAMLPTYGKTITLTIWAAVKQNKDQKIEIMFYDESDKFLGAISENIDKLVEDSPWGLRKYTIAGTVPETTKRIRIQGSSSQDDYLAVDGGCLIFTGPALPVTLASFNASKEGNTASLKWTTSVETNSGYFDVQHSGDGKNWIKLATIEAQGESKELITYNYTHSSPFAVNLYRLKMVDLDGTFAYSSIKSLKFDGEEQMNIFPNPTTDRIKLSSNQPITNVKVYNQSGVLVLNTRPDASNEIDLSRMAQGTYYVKINDGQVTRKLLVVR